jgi:polyhydroxyalkanoate synthesis regulator phasin
MTNNENTKKKEAAASTTTPKAKTIKGNFNDNSAHNQRLKILDWLFEKGSITTDQAREHLDVMHPAGRIKELREAGYLIITIRVRWTSEFGIKHSVAKYVLTRKEPVEALNLAEAA